MDVIECPTCLGERFLDSFGRTDSSDKITCYTCNGFGKINREKFKPINKNKAKLSWPLMNTSKVG